MIRTACRIIRAASARKFLPIPWSGRRLAIHGRQNSPLASFPSSWSGHRLAIHGRRALPVALGLFSWIAITAPASAQVAGAGITLEQIFAGTELTAEHAPELVHSADGRHFYLRDSDSPGRILKAAYSNPGKTNVAFDIGDLVKAGLADSLSLVGFRFSPDESWILVETESKQIYRHSTMGKFLAWNLSAGGFHRIADGEWISYPDFSPDSRSIAYVRGNNLYIQDLMSGLTTPITKDGQENAIINGSSDWVYEEELFLTKAYEWSPDSRFIAWYRFDESAVKEFTLTMYEGLYPGSFTFKYPKVGERNSSVTIHVHDTRSGLGRRLETNPDFDHYIPGIHWTGEASTLMVLVLNREQNRLEYRIFNVESGEGRLVLIESSPWYLEMGDPPGFIDGGERFVITSERDGYNHVYLYHTSGKLEKQLTSGAWEVTKVLGIDEKRDRLYYQSTEGSPLERKIYVVGLDGSGKKLLSPMPGINGFEFSETYEYYVHSNHQAGVPPAVSLCHLSGQVLKSFTTNEALLKKVSDARLPSPEMFTFMTPDSVELNGWMMKPADFDAGKRHPVLMFVYGGPGSQTVRNEWGSRNRFWFNYLNQLGYIVVSVDNRGTGGRGREFRCVTYRNLGIREAQDQVDAAVYLGGLPYVDPTRIGIFGWSYGGYMSTLCLALGADVFKAAIAVAPVTDWRYYDSIYTERYMGLIDDNPEGYEMSAPTYYAGRIKGAYLLVHGMADDNVHFQNTSEMIKALVGAGVQFDLFVYPDRNHALPGQSTRLHLYGMMTDFVKTNL